MRKKPNQVNNPIAFFLVGGAVRDRLLGYPFNEKDWVVVGATPDDLLKQGYRPVGKDFPVFIHPDTGEEYALARTERKTAPGYKGFSFHTDPSVTLEEDLLRRDLTINAMAQDTQGNIIDPYGGQTDLSAKTLRHVSAAFSEDPVRILRVARFTARYHHLGFVIAPETLALMQTMVAAGETQHLVAERVWQECAKALAEHHPACFFETLQQCGAITDIFPELAGDTFVHSLTLLQQMAATTEQPQLRFAAVCYPLEVEHIDALCQRLAVPNRFRELAGLIRRFATAVQTPTQQTAETIAAVLQQSDASRKPERFALIVEGCIGLGNPNQAGVLNTFWQGALDHYQQVDTQALVARGYAKAELGQAIQRERVQQLAHFLSSFDKSDINTL